MPLEQAQQMLRNLHQDWCLHDNALRRIFLMQDYNARLVQTIAAVAQEQAHFPRSITLERQVAKSGTWRMATVVECQTVVLRGLSVHDFHLAMVRMYDC